MKDTTIGFNTDTMKGIKIGNNRFPIEMPFFQGPGNLAIQKWRSEEEKCMERGTGGKRCNRSPAPEMSLTQNEETGPAADDILNSGNRTHQGEIEEDGVWKIVSRSSRKVRIRGNSMK